MTKQYSLAELLELMARLRTPETGCPWDLAQSYASITPSTIEEAYEVVDAIECEDYQHLKEELGDLLFQVVFYAQLAREESRFTFADVISGVTEKLLRRHPHVFPDGRLESVRDPNSELESEHVGQRWEQIKAEERKAKGELGLLDDVPRALPSLQRAQKLQKRVAKAGMDFQSASDALKNLEEEIAELREAIESQNQPEVESEMGDVFFSCINVARKLRLDADQSLRQSNRKFEQRIKQMDALVQEGGLTWSDLSDSDQDRLWQESKGILEQKK